MNVGRSFSAFNQDPTAGGYGRPSISPVQDAIKILSLRLPTTVGPNSPSGVLAGGPSVAGPGSGTALAENWLRLLFSGQLGMGPGGAPDMGGMGMPDLSWFGSSVGGPMAGRAPTPSVIYKEPPVSTVPAERGDYLPDSAGQPPAGPPMPTSGGFSSPEMSNPGSYDPFDPSGGGGAVTFAAPDFLSWLQQGGR